MHIHVISFMVEHNIGCGIKTTCYAKNRSLDRTDIEMNTTRTQNNQNDNWHIKIRRFHCIELDSVLFCKQEDCTDSHHYDIASCISIYDAVIFIGIFAHMCMHDNHSLFFSGMPQGLVLGSLLCLVYINDVTQSITSTIRLSNILI